MTRSTHATVVLAHALPPMLGIVWFQTVGVEAAPGGRWLWIPLLFVVAPALAACVSLGRRWAFTASAGYGVLMALSSLGVAITLPSGHAQAGWAMVLAETGMCWGALLAMLAAIARFSARDALDAEGCVTSRIPSSSES